MNKNKLRPFKKQKGFDYFLFTNNKIKDKTNWTILPIPEIINNLNISIIKKQRFIKLHPHLFFVNYDISIYMDTSCVIKGDLNIFLEKILSPKFNLFFFEHPRRNSIYSEINSVISMKKELKEKALLIMKRYKNKKFPDNYGLSDNKMIIRKHNKKNCIKLMEKWWDEIYKYSHRDQLSLSYIIWNTGIKVKYISRELLFEYFSFFAHIKRIKF